VVFSGDVGKEAVMSKRDALLVVSAAVLGSLLTYFIGVGGAQPDAPVRASSTAPARSPAATPMPRNATGTLQTAATQAGESQTVPADAPRPHAARLDENEARKLIMIGQKQQKFGEQLARFIEDGGNSDPAAINARLEDRFYSEQLNREWAGSRESHIRTLFEGNENLRGIDPVQVACRSKNCQVVLSASSFDQARVVSEKFMQAATRGDVGMQDQAVSFFPDVSAGRVVFYLSENGNTDLFR
jgi:hypothetical protein